MSAPRHVGELLDQYLEDLSARCAANHWGTAVASLDDHRARVQLDQLQNAGTAGDQRPLFIGGTAI